MVISTLLVVVVMSTVAWLLNRNIEKELEIPLLKTLGSYAATLEGGTITSRAMGAAILFGQENQEAKKLAMGKLPPDAPEVLSALNTLRTLYIADTAILVNKRGVIVADSNKNNEHGTGQDIFSRPDVQLAIHGTPSVYPAMDLSGADRGIYLSAPLRPTSNDMAGSIGAILVRVGPDKLDALLKSWTDGIAVLLSPQGVAFSASREDWVFRTTGETGTNRTADVQRGMKVGDPFGRTSRARLPFTLDAPETSIDGVRYAVRTLPVDWDDPNGDWVLTFLERRPPWWTRLSVLGFAGLAGGITALGLLWFFILARNALLLKSLNDKLQQNEAILRQSDALLKESQIIAGLGTYAVDIPSGRLESSEVLDKLFGIDKEYERSLEGWAALIHPDDRTMMVDYFRNEVLADRKVFDKEYRIIRHNDLAERWVHGLGKLEVDADGHLVKMQGTILDITERKQLELELKQLLITDSLTGLYNQRHFFAVLEPELERAKRYGRPLSLLCIDLDNFKQVNDVFGHLEGDEALRLTARVIQKELRNTDLAFRFGGDEFMVLLLEADSNEAKRIGSRIRASFDRHWADEWNTKPGCPLVSLSLGIAEFDQRESPQTLVHRADDNMYVAKKHGIR